MNFDLDDYVPVGERLDTFRSEHPTWGLRSEILVDDGERIVIRAWITDDVNGVVAVGHAEEIRGSSPVNRTSALENAETSAWGRALANLGYDVKRGVASREEMAKVAARTPRQVEPRGVADTNVEGGSGRGPSAKKTPTPPAPLRAQLRQRLNARAASERAEIRAWWFEQTGQKILDVNAIVDKQLPMLGAEMEARGW